MSLHLLLLKSSMALIKSWSDYYSSTLTIRLRIPAKSATFCSEQLLKRKIKGPGIAHSLKRRYQRFVPKYIPNLYWSLLQPSCLLFLFFFHDDGFTKTNLLHSWSGQLYGIYLGSSVTRWLDHLLKIWLFKRKKIDPNSKISKPK